MAASLFRRGFIAPAELRAATFVTASIRRQPPAIRMISSMPTIAQSSFWKSLIPKPLRPGNARADKKPRSKGWNPATFFIIIFLLIGSMSIQMITLKNEFEAFMRQSDVRIGLLREVVEKIQKGEEVDVERALGTGDPAMEKRWEEVLQEIEREDISRPQKKQDKPKQPESPTATRTKSAENHAQTRSSSSASFY